MLSQGVKFSSFYGQVVFHCVNIPSCFTQSSTDGHLGCFHILATVNNSAVNIGVLMSFQICVLGFFRYIPRSGILGPKAVPFLIFWGNSILLSAVAAPVCIPIQHCKIIFSTSLPTLAVCWFIDDSHSDQCEVILHYGFNLYFSDD